MQPLDSDHDASVEKSADGPVFHTSGAHGDGSNDNYLIGAAVDQLRSKPSGNVAAEVGRAEQGGVREIALAIVEAEVNDIGARVEASVDRFGNVRLPERQNNRRIPVKNGLLAIERSPIGGIIDTEISAEWIRILRTEYDLFPLICR